ncbi:MAG: hypothetical protein H6658_00380 [Ardenticatenaceae bacterium]|nr:hypothetical protein [Ardenticatenaceae bacterium]
MREPETGPAAPVYSAFLLRCWWRDGRWHFTIENIANRKQWHAPSLHTLMADILSELADPNENEDGQ